MECTNSLTKWVIDKIEKEYRDDIALLIAVKGHSTDNDGHGEVFDYYVPDSEKGNELAQTFIIGGIGHDLYPRSWERLEKSANLNEMTLVLANAEVLYARSKEAADKFHALQQKLADNLKNPVFIYTKALERLDSAMELYRTLAFEEKSYRARSQACFIHLYLSQAVAFMNHSFTDSPLFSEKQTYDPSPESRIYHCPDLVLVPDSFFEYARQLLTGRDVNQIRHIIHSLIRTTKKFVLERKPQIETKAEEINYQNLADWYQELSLTWRRIHFFCQENMVENAYKDACYLQDELLVIAEEFHLEEFNVLDSFTTDSLIHLSMRCQSVEQVIRRIITAHGIRINEYASLDDFLAANA